MYIEEKIKYSPYICIISLIYKIIITLTKIQVPIEPTYRNKLLSLNYSLYFKCS